MKLLLTSAGLMNKKISRELLRLAGRPARNLSVAFIPTAANAESGDKSWFIKDLVLLKNMKFRQVDIVDISALPRTMWEKRLREADVMVVSGGNTFHLMYWLKKSGLATLLPSLLKKRVYVGISAGSIVTNPALKLGRSEKLDPYFLPLKSNAGLGFVNFGVRPHYNTPFFTNTNGKPLEVFAQNAPFPFYALDDQSAISVDGKKVAVISEGKWRKFA